LLRLQVNDQDTLTRLAVHYDVTEHAIKRANQFLILGTHMDNLVGKQIRVPRSRGYIAPPKYDECDEEAKERRRIVQVCYLNIDTASTA
jgi:LysM repeat protein